MRKIINGLTINYRIRCNKNRDNFVLLLHGWGGSLDSFKGVENYLIENNFSIINLDFPGFGYSELPPENFEMIDYMNLVKKILITENIVKTNVIAHSFGGRVAILLASETNFVNKLILIDSAGLKPKFSLSKWCKIRKYKFLKWCNKYLKTKFNLTKFGSEDYRAMPEQLKPVFSRIVNTDLKKNIHNIDAPTLLVWGDKDKSTPLYMAKRMKKNLKDCGLVIYKNCGHFSYLEKFNDFCIVAKNFLDN